MGRLKCGTSQRIFIIAAASRHLQSRSAAEGENGGGDRVDCVNEASGHEGMDIFIPDAGLWGGRRTVLHAH